MLQMVHLYNREIMWKSPEYGTKALWEINTPIPVDKIRKEKKDSAQIVLLLHYIYSVE